MTVSSSLSVSHNGLHLALANMLTGRSGLQGDDRAEFNKLVLRLAQAQDEGHSCIEVDAEQADILTRCREVSDGSDITPLVLENQRLYLQRYWEYERRLVCSILPRVSTTGNADSAGDLPKLLDHYFPGEGLEQGETDWQRKAAEGAALNRFTIITGGPGTGKTTTVLKILALLQELHQCELSIALAAPTGKAAMRLQQSISDGKQHLSCDESVTASIPEQAGTLHRLLKPLRKSITFKHNSDNPVDCDLLVVDEASMIDLAMMSKLIDALPTQSRLILLGDRDQLASVESGAVLSDLCVSLPDNTQTLKKTWRFDGPIRDLAVAVNEQRAEDAWDLLLDADAAAVARLKVAPAQAAARYYQPYLEAIDGKNPAKAYRAFSQFQVLTALRAGPLGVEQVNKTIEVELSKHGLSVSGGWYHGRPVMITRNDHQLGLFNGDIGLCLRTGGVLQVWFGLDEGQPRPLNPARIPEHETAFAMTVHKSQGSEFAHVMIVLPGQVNALLSRELLYTAITRARERVQVVSEKSVFLHTVKQRVQRLSGLREKLSGVKE